EKIDSLIDIKIGKQNTLRVLSEIQDGELLDPSKMSLYFDYYFYARTNDMAYSITRKEVNRDDTLLNLLSENKLNMIVNSEDRLPMLRQSFMTAGRIFKAIDAPTHSVIVPFGEG